jgi:hypothetical protein
LEVKASVIRGVVIPRFDKVPDSRRERAVSAKVVSCLGLAEAQWASRVVRPSSDGKHISGKELSMKG